MREALGQTPGIPELQPRVPPTSFSAAVSSMNREAWPGFPVLMNNTPGRHRGEGVASAQEGLGKHLALGWARVCPPRRHNAELIPALREGLTSESRQREAQAGRGSEAEALSSRPPWALASSGLVSRLHRDALPQTRTHTRCSVHCKRQ